MLVRVDDWLLDRVFQPWADRLADRVSPLVLGATLLDVSAVIAIVQMLYRGLHGLMSWGGVTLIILVLGFGLGALVKDLKRMDARLKLGQANPFRYRYRFLRCLVLVTSTYDFVRLALGGGETLFLTLGTGLGVGLLVAGLFFGACQKMPPASREEQRVPGRMAMEGA